MLDGLALQNLADVVERPAFFALAAVPVAAVPDKHIASCAQANGTNITPHVLTNDTGAAKVRGCEHVCDIGYVSRCVPQALPVCKEWRKMWVWQ